MIHKGSKGCRRRLLELRSFYPASHIAKLVDKAEKLVYKHKPMDGDETHNDLCSFSLKAASREDSSDNYIYYPKAKSVHPEDLRHFQWHWRKGEPVIVRNVLEEGTHGLTWEPSAMSDALCNTNHKTVNPIDCSNGHEVCAILNLNIEGSWLTFNVMLLSFSENLFTTKKFNTFGISKNSNIFFFFNSIWFVLFSVTGNFCIFNLSC